MNNIIVKLAMSADELKEYAERNEDELIHLAESVSEVVQVDVEEMLDDYINEAISSVARSIEDNIHDLFAGHVADYALPDDMIVRLGQDLAKVIEANTEVRFDVECYMPDTIDRFITSEFNALRKSEATDSHEDQTDSYEDQIGAFLNR